MNKIAEYPGCLIAKTDWGVVELIAAPEEVRNQMEGSCLDDNCHRYGVPNLEVGVYVATIELWFSQGYSEGFKDDRESETDLQITDCRMQITPPGRPRVM